jgi:signal transduction histidine kinase
MKNVKLRTAIALSLIVGIIVPTIIAGWYTEVNRHKIMAAELEEHHQQLTTTLALAMQEPIWVLVPEKGLPIVDAIMTDNRVLRVTITTEDGVFIEKIRGDTLAKDHLILELPVFYQGTRIGAVQTAMDTGPLHASLSKQRNEFLLLTLAQLGVSLFIIFLLLNSKVLRPVKRLIVQSEKLAKGKLEEKFSWEQTDELGLLGKSLDQARQELLDSFNKLNQMHAQTVHDAEELAEARDQAEAANRAKSEFLDNMSHELRTPLNGIMGMLQLMESTSPDEKQQEYARSALEASKNLNAIIEEVLALSKVEAGKLTIGEEEFLLPDIPRSVVEPLKQDALEKGIDLQYSINEDIPPMLLGDPNCIMRTLFNLVENAVKFTEHGEIRIRVDYERPDKNEDSINLLFSVSDTGIGIPQDKLQFIFEPFSQVSGGHTRKYQGTGMGLAIAKRLVEAMDGEMSVESREGEGTTFRFSTLIKTPPLAGR